MAQEDTTNSEPADAAGDEPRTKKVRIDPEVSSSSGGRENARRSRPPPPPASFTATLPSTGLDVLLIGRADLSRPLAESMLSVTFDRQTVSNNTAPSGNQGKNNKRSRKEMTSSVSTCRGKGDPAIEALRRHLRRSSAADANTGGSRGGGVGSFGLTDVVRARHVRLVESLSDLFGGHEMGKGDEQEQAKNDSNTATEKPNDTNNNDVNGKTDPRVDHAVIVLAPTDPFSSSRLRQAAASLHPDYAIQGRVTIVYAVGGSGDNGNDGPARTACPDLDRLLEDVERGVASKLSSMTRGGSTGSNTDKMPLFASSVPVLRCNLKESHSRLAVARMILQRTKMGSRGCMGADDGLDVVVSSQAGGVGDESNAFGGGEEEGNISAGLKSEIDGTKGGISPLFFSSVL